MAFKLWHLPLRAATGAYILDSGLQKQSADEETARSLHGFATAAYPELEAMPPERFASMLSTGEIAVGSLLLAPLVPTSVAGLALTTFAALLGRLYLKTPGLREEGSLRPTQQGIPVAKDVWLLAIGTALAIDGMAERRGRRRRARAGTS